MYWSLFLNHSNCDATTQNISQRRDLMDGNPINNKAGGGCPVMHGGNTGNYRVILEYNCSNYYAMSVGLLADEIVN